MYIIDIYILPRPPTHNMDPKYVHCFSVFLQESKEIVNVFLFHPFIMISRISRLNSPENISFT